MVLAASALAKRIAAIFSLLVSPALGRLVETAEKVDAPVEMRSGRSAACADRTDFLAFSTRSPSRTLTIHVQHGDGGHVRGRG